MSSDVHRCKPGMLNAYDGLKRADVFVVAKNGKTGANGYTLTDFRMQL